MIYPTKKLGEVIELRYGKGIPKDDRKSDGKYPIYGANGILGYSDKYLIDGEAVIVGRKGSVGEITRVSRKFWPSDVTYYVLGNKEVNVDYIFHLLKSLNLQRLATGVKPGVNRNRIYELEIPLPPFAEQKKIVAKLEKLLGKIKEAKYLNSEAQDVAKNLLPAELHKIFEEGKKKGWEEKELGEICELNPKKSEIKDKADDLLVSFVPMSAVNEYSQKITFFEERRLNQVRKGYTYFKNGDVLFAKITPCMENGKVAIAKDLKNGIGFGTTEFHVVRAKEHVLPEWVYYIIRQPFFRDIAKTKMTGSAGQKRVPIQFLKTYKIPIPPLTEQKKIVAHLDSLSEKIKKLQECQKATTSSLIALEQSILHKAFNRSL
jgi:type I restriction enzyme S subunit